MHKAHTHDDDWHPKDLMVNKCRFTHVLLEDSSPHPACDVNGSEKPRVINVDETLELVFFFSRFRY